MGDGAYIRLRTLSSQIVLGGSDAAGGTLIPVAAELLPVVDVRCKCWRTFCVYV